MDHDKSESRTYGKLKENEVWWDAVRIMRHELGHTLGLNGVSVDFYTGLMKSPHDWPDLESDDVGYLRQVYYPHDH